MDAGTGTLMPIGRFARMTGLTVKALRHYGELGLLEPACVDDATGYRYYRLGQARRAEAIRRLRELEVPLDEVRVLLDAPPPLLRERLVVHRARLEGRAVETRKVIHELDLLIEGKETLVPDMGEEAIRTKFQLDVQEVPEMYTLVISERVPTEDIDAAIPRLIGEVGAYAGEHGVATTGPPVCVYAEWGGDGTAVIEVGGQVPEGTHGRGPIKPKAYGGTRALVLEHTGPYTEIARAYRLIEEAMERDGLTPAGPPMDVYLSDPREVADPNEYRTRIVWPIGPEGDLTPPEGDVLIRLDKR